MEDRIRDGRTIAEVNSFSRDSKIASLDLFPIIKCGARAAARLIPGQVNSKGGERVPFQDMVESVVCEATWCGWFGGILVSVWITPVLPGVGIPI
jgi:hypothetical protein